MIAMHTVLCPVDFSAATARQVALAAGLSRLYGARLVLHHNLASLPPGAGVGWMWSADDPPLSQEAAGEQLQTLAGTIGSGLKVELSITEGPASSAVLAVSDAVDADLLVLSTHHATTEDHTSVTAEVLDRTRRAVLALHEATDEPHVLRFDLGSGVPQAVLVPTDLTAESYAAVDFAFELAATLPLDVHLVHFRPHLASAHRQQTTEVDAEKRLRGLVPQAFVASTHVHVREGDPGTGIVHAATELGVSCIIMGEHTRAPLRRWFSRDTSHGVLHDAPCPVWYVPGTRSA